jgi:hypothetical protein
MATYIQGLTDYIPKAEPYKPNFDFLNTVLATRQARYDSALNQLSGAYGSIVYADLTRDDNRIARDNFLKNSEKAIQQITSLDLSDPANVQMAQQVFQPFVDDRKIQYDIMFTKGVRKGQEYSNSVRTSSDPDIQSKWSPISDKGLEYKQIEFRTAPQEKAYKMPVPKYVPGVNIAKMAHELIGDDFKNISVEELKGGYTITTTGGPKSINVIRQYLSMALGADPNVNAFASEQAYVTSMNDITALANQKYNGDINAAKQEYYINNADVALENDMSRLEDVQESVSETSSKLSVYESRINRGDKLSQKEQANYNALLKEKATGDGIVNNLTDRIKQINTAIETQDIDLLGRAFQASKATSFISNQLAEASETEAYKNYSVKRDVDEYRFEEYKNALEFSTWTKKEKIRQDFEREKMAIEAGGQDQFMAGSTSYQAGVSGDPLAADRQEFNTSWKQWSGSVASLAQSIYNTNDPKLQSAINSAVTGAGYSMDALNQGKIGLTGLNKIQQRIENMLSADPNLSKKMAPLLIVANDRKQLAYTNSSIVASNNKKVVSNMIASNEYNPNLLGAMFTGDGSLRDVNSAYKALANSGYPMSFGTFAENYADISEEYKANYVNFAQNKTGYRPVGTGGDGQYISNYVTGVADPKKFMSPTTIGFIGVMNDVNNPMVKVGVGNASDINAQSGNVFADMESIPELKAYLNNFRSKMAVTKTPVAYDYAGRALGNNSYHSLTIRPSANDAELKALKEAGKISGDQYNNIIARGITAIIPREIVTNPIASRLETSDRQMILTNTGKYRYKNPVNNIDITFTQNNDGSISASGTAYNSATGRTDPFIQNSMNSIYFNNLLSRFDQISE